MRVKLAAFVVLGIAAFAFAHERATSKHTYNQHVRPIFQKHCAECHSAGGIAPMSLMTYDDASPWSAAIRTQVLERTMPPFLPEEGVGDFRGSRYLSAQEIEAIVDWATGGTPEGDPARLTPEVPLRREWKPDVILPLPMVIVPADETEKSQCLELPRGSGLVKAIEFQPGNREIVHDAQMFADPGCRLAPIETWLPGQEPSGSTTARPNSVRIHYRKTWRHDGKELRDQSRVGLYVAGPSAKPSRFVRVNRSYKGDFEVLSIFTEGPGRVEANGKMVLEIDHFDPGWNTKYQFVEPIRVKNVVSTAPIWLELRPKL